MKLESTNIKQDNDEVENTIKIMIIFLVLVNNTSKKNMHVLYSVKRNDSDESSV